MTPLSGPTNTCPPALSTTPARSVPTPGSTTTRCTVPVGKYGVASHRIRAASATFCAGTSCVMSHSDAAGLTVKIEPFIAPT